MLSNPFARLLADNRTRFNSKFIEARHYSPRLGPEAFSQHLLTAVAPIVEAVHSHAPEQTAAIAELLYDLSLDLVAHDLLGPEARYPHLAKGWATLLPRLARFIILAPRRVIGSITNALYNLSAAPGARPREWLEMMLTLAEHCADVEALLTVGQIAAWRAGLAHYRLDALKLSEKLAAPNPALAHLALGLPNAADLSSALSQLRVNPWVHPASITQSPITNHQLQIVSRVGAFRGFGGLFMAPPLVMVEDGRLVVWEGDNFWWLMADAFGATFTRCGEPSLKEKDSGIFKIDSKGKATHGKLSRAFPELAGATSAASLPHTLAVTTALSHAVILIAVGEGEEER